MTDGTTFEFAARLLAITDGCRKDMHEPDEQGLTARVIGTKLDNAGGDEIDINAISDGYQEIIVMLKREGRPIQRFNLATLISLARFGALMVTDQKML